MVNNNINNKQNKIQDISNLNNTRHNKQDNKQDKIQDISNLYNHVNSEQSNLNKINYSQSNLNLEKSSVTNNEVKLLREVTDLKKQNKELLGKLNRFAKQSEKFKELKKELRELKKMEKERKKLEKQDVPETKNNMNTGHINNVMDENEMFLKDFLSNKVGILRPSLLNFNDRILVQNPFKNMDKMIPQNLKNKKCKDDECKNKYMFYTYKSSNNGNEKEGKEVQVIGDGDFATVTEKSLPNGKKRVFKINIEDIPKLLKM